MLSAYRLLEIAQTVHESCVAFLRPSEKGGRKLYVPGTALIINSEVVPLLLTAGHVVEELCTFVTGTPGTAPTAIAEPALWNIERTRDVATLKLPAEYLFEQNKVAYKQRSWPIKRPFINEIVYAVGCPTRLLARSSKCDDKLRFIAIPLRVMSGPEIRDYILADAAVKVDGTLPKPSAKRTLALRKFGGMSGAPVFRVLEDKSVSLCGVYSGASATDTSLVSFAPIDHLMNTGRFASAEIV